MNISRLLLLLLLVCLVDSWMLGVNFERDHREFRDIEVILFAVTIVKLMALVMYGYLPIKGKIVGKRSLHHQPRNIKSIVQVGCDIVYINIILSPYHEILSKI